MSVRSSAFAYGLAPMLRKEWLENVRTHRLHVTLAAFVLVGAGSPLLTWSLPELLRRLPADSLEGVEVVLMKAPGVAQAMAQFQRNQVLLAMLVILANMGGIGNELQRGTLRGVLSLPISRAAVVLAKLMVPAGCYAAAAGLGALLNFAYTSVLFGELDPGRYLLVSALDLVALLTHLALMVALGAAGISPAVAAALGFATLIASGVAARWTLWLSWLPGSPFHAAERLIQGQQVPEIGRLVIASLSFAGLSLAWGAWRFQRSEP